MAPINRELLKGGLDLLVLTLLEREPMYGFLIIKVVRQHSMGELNIKEGALYPALHRLEQAGLIEGFWQPRTDGADRRYYRLTERGGEIARAKREEWYRYTSAIEGVLQYAAT